MSEFMSFSKLGVADDVVAALRARGIEAPTPIQRLTVPDALAGRDVCGQAPTGSGKTVAFGIALVAAARPARPRHPSGLVLVPTRELATQVAGELSWLGARTRVRTGSCFGGVPLERQRRQFRQGIEVLVACPGRLADFMARGDLSLDAVETLVIDEADRMADMGFLPQVRRIVDRIPSSRQTLLFSATLGGEVDSLIRRYQRNPVMHRVRAEARERDRAKHLFWQVHDHERVSVCARIVMSSGPTIVFCRTRRRADRVARQLAGSGVRAAALHGARSQAQRTQALDAFANGRVDALVATNLAARGIHVDGVACVVHFDPTDEPTDYTHRAGRTARAGMSGTVISLIDGTQVRSIERLQRALGLPAGLSVPHAGGLSEKQAARRGT